MNLCSSVQINNVMTDSFSVESEVRQGDNLAPTLFILYINDLIPVINELESKRGKKQNCAVQASYLQIIHCEVFYR